MEFPPVTRTPIIRLMFWRADTKLIAAAIQRSKDPLKELSERYGLNLKMIANWKKRAFVTTRRWDQKIRARSFRTPRSD